MSMREEYDFSNAKRGVFYRPNDEKRYLISFDHRPLGGEFEVYSDENGHYRYRLRNARGAVVVTSETFETKDEAIRSIEALRETVIGAETVVAK
jgi:uncharacterized protein YegP (UPF0339 family)